MKILTKILLLTMLLINAAWAETDFVIKNIEVRGLYRLSEPTVESYLPVKRGQRFSFYESREVVKSLYKTGFFQRISVSARDNTLIITVVERATIGQLKITGNSVIPTDKLTPALKNLDITEGRIYNPLVLERVKQGLLNQYYQLGRYNARVDIKVADMSRNRKSVTIDISEGLVAKVRRINIIGEHAFSEKTLLKQLDLTTPGLLTFYTQTDRYSQEKFAASVEKLRNFYLDNGYLHVVVKASQTEIAPDKKSVYVTFVINEGELYKVSGVSLQGKLILPEAKVRKFLTIKPGEVFSRQKIIDIEKAITTEYGNSGYLFATINLKPEINEVAHTVHIIFEIMPGKLTYVRHISFSDNTRTNDVALRRELTQMEGAPASFTNLNESKHRISLLSFIKDVDMSINPVPGSKDQVDTEFKVKEDSSAQASLKFGVSQNYGLTLGAGFNQKNVLGTGNTLGVNFQRSKYDQLYAVDYTNPYYTPDGISRSFSFSVSRIDPGKIPNFNSGYISNDYSLGVLYGIPIGEEEGIYHRLLAGVSYQDTLLHLQNEAAGSNLSNQVIDFTNRFGRHFQEFDFKIGLSRDSRDKSIFPTKGGTQSIFLDVYAPANSTSLTFSTLTYHGKLYVPLVYDFIFTTKADLGYGKGFNGSQSYPFFKNFYAGGIDSVRGYRGYTLGPRDSYGRALGGNMLADASVGLIFPNFISENLRTTLFFDGGNVYSTEDNRVFGGYSLNAGSLRYSFGLAADMITPLGLINLSVAKPLNIRGSNPPGSGNGDDREVLQWSFGTSF